MFSSNSAIVILPTTSRQLVQQLSGWGCITFWNIQLGCPGIYTSSWSCPSQLTLSFTAVSGTAQCLLFQFHTCQNLASANPSLSITVIIWANPFPGISPVCGGIKARMNLTHHILNKIHVPGAVFMSSSITGHVSLGAFSLLGGLAQLTNQGLFPYQQLIRGRPCHVFGTLLSS